MKLVKVDPRRHFQRGNDRFNVGTIIVFMTVSRFLEANRTEGMLRRNWVNCVKVSCLSNRIACYLAKTELLTDHSRRHSNVAFIKVTFTRLCPRI